MTIAMVDTVKIMTKIPRLKLDDFSACEALKINWSHRFPLYEFEHLKKY